MFVVNIHIINMSWRLCCKYEAFVTPKASYLQYSLVDMLPSYWILERKKGFKIWYEAEHARLVTLQHNFMSVVLMLTD